MPKIRITSSNLPCIGMLAGMLLLGLAATLVVMTPTHLAVEDEQARRLQAAPLVTTPVPLPLVTTPVPLATAPVTTPPSVGEMTGEVEHTEIWRNSVFYSGGSTWGAVLVDTLIGICFALLYKKNTVDKVLDKKGSIEELVENGKRFADEGQDDFDVGICGCFDDMWVCVHGLLCPMVRMAHTNEVAGVMGFWETILAMFCCTLASGPLGQCLLTVYFRKKLKKIMGIEDHLINDCCVACFLPNLSICQSGTAVDRALEYEVTGCCDLEWTYDGDNE